MDHISYLYHPMVPMTCSKELTRISLWSSRPVSASAHADAPAGAGRGRGRASGSLRRLGPRRATFASKPGAEMSVPSSTISPSSIGSRRLMHRNRVLLPEPDAPMNATTLPRGTSSETPRSTSFLPNALWTPRMERCAFMPRPSWLRSACVHGRVASRRCVSVEP